MGIALKKPDPEVISDLDATLAFARRLDRLMSHMPRWSASVWRAAGVALCCAQS
jgi:hypothetical protein